MIRLTRARVGVTVLVVALALPRALAAQSTPNRAEQLNAEVVQLYRQGRFAEAIPKAREALALREEALGATHPEVARSLNNLAALLETTGDPAAARRLYERALAIREQTLGPSHPDVAVSLNNLAGVLIRSRDYTRARALYERALAIQERTLGPTHPDVAVSLNNLAYLHYTTGDAAGARALYERARLADLALARAGVELGDEGTRTLRAYGLSMFHQYVGLLARIAREPFRDATVADPSAHAFVVAEQARGSAAQAALGRASARLVSGSAVTADLARQAQTLRDRLNATRKLVVAELGLALAERDAARLGALRQETERLAADLQDSTARLRAAFPRYAELASPDPIDVATTRSLLREGEALVSFFSLEDRVLVWLVRPGRPLVYREQAIGRADLAALVSRVRGGFDQSANTELSAARLTPIDFSGAHQLYQLLLNPLAPDLTGVTHLLVVPDEVLLPVPFAALLTRTSGRAVPVALSAYPRLPWLVREHAITVLPSATSLRLLRRASRVLEPSREPLIAFGDPVFQGSGATRGGTMLAARGSSVDVRTLKELSRLPGTRDELLALARALGADARTSLYLDARATKPQVMSLNASGRLGRARVLAFSTHGLLAGEVRGLKQPALALTPPARPTEDDDGFLALDDIVGLRLTGTDWVVLSACNTAAADASGEALSGLTRAFFYAGAPSLLVSHWSVDDRATQTLMTRVFEAYARDPGLPRAELLRRGMLALIAEAQGTHDYFAHPFAWAGFFLVGEGDR